MAVSRKAVSLREYIDASGGVTEKIAEAIGARYTILANKKSIERVFEGAAAGTPLTMSAVFGWLNKVGNIVVSGVNDRGLTADEAHAAAEEWNTDINTSVWERPNEGGPNIDLDALSKALAGMEGAKGDEAHYLNRLKTEKGYAQRAIQVPLVRDAYHAAKGTTPKKPKTVADVI